MTIPLLHETFGYAVSYAEQYFPLLHETVGYAVSYAVQVLSPVCYMKLLAMLCKVVFVENVSTNYYSNLLNELNFLNENQSTCLQENTFKSRSIKPDKATSTIELRANTPVHSRRV